jgi:hypothetical protein
VKNVDASAYPDTLQCPYPECPGARAEADVRGEVVACPKCGRLAARCPHGSARRCPTLNRALARHCRCCGRPLPAGWAQQRWALDLPAARGPADNGTARRGLALEKDRQVVLSLKGWLQFRPWPGGWPLTLLEAGGRLWVGAPDSSYLSVDPFLPARGPAPVSGGPLWPEAAPLRLRARAAGPWLVLYADPGIRVLNLLAVDDPRHREHYTAPVWTARPDERLASEPVLLRHAGDGLGQGGRTLAWATHGPRGLSLWLVPLALAADHRAPPRQLLLPMVTVRTFVAGEPPAQVVLAEAPLGARDGLFLCTPQHLWLADVPAPGARDLPRLQKLLSKPRFLINHQDMPGLVFVPGAPADGTEPRGTLFVAHRGGEGPSAQDLLEVVTISERGLVENFSGLDQGGVPVDALRTPGEREVLALAGRTLLRCDAHGNQVRVLTSEYLLGTMRGHVYRDLAVCTGFDAAPGQGHFVTMLVDLADNALVTNGLLLADSLEAHPVLLGSHLFTLERVDGDLCLTRRRLPAPPKSAAPP